jgi:hypothetical protein
MSPAASCVLQVSLLTYFMCSASFTSNLGGGGGGGGFEKIRAVLIVINDAIEGSITLAVKRLSG